MYPCVARIDPEQVTEKIGFAGRKFRVKSWIAAATVYKDRRMLNFLGFRRPSSPLLFSTCGLAEGRGT